MFKPHCKKVLLWCKTNEDISKWPPTCTYQKHSVFINLATKPGN